MKTGKRVLSFLLAATMLLSLAACGKEKTGNKNGKVDQIQIDTADAAIRYVGYEYVPQVFFSMGVGNREKTIFIKFEYTNKKNEPVNFQSNFNLSVTQNGEALNMLKVFNSEADTTAIMNYYNGTATNETLPVHYPVIMKDYSPLTITVSTVSEKETIVQNMNLEVEVPEGVIVPDDLPVEPTELVADWINPQNGDELEIKEGKINPKTNTIEGGAYYTPADDTLNTWNSINKYKLEGDIIKLSEERFRVTKENDKLYFKSLDSDTTYMRRSDFYKFEDAEVHQLGDTISTDTVELTLNYYGYADLVDPNTLGGHATLIKKEPFAPENGMTWAKVSYGLFNKSNKSISISAFDSNIRFSVVYQNNYTFGMEKHDGKSVITGDGYFEHVQVLGAGLNEKDKSFLPLARENFDVWFPVAPAVRDDTSAKLYLLVLLPKNGGTELFVYEVKN